MSGISRRTVLAAGLAAGIPGIVPAAAKLPPGVPPALGKDMYDAALRLARQHIRGGDNEPFFKQPFLDAAFSANIFLWDSCFMCSYAKYHQDQLPAAAALDNFYALQEDDGYICREYTREGVPYWSKDHPVSINPPLLAFAELELYSVSKDSERLKRVYPHLQAFFRFIEQRYRCADGLFFSDALGSGMDNIPRYPFGWKDDGGGVSARSDMRGHFGWLSLSSQWNRQGRSVDLSAQMALCALNLATIANIVGADGDVAAYRSFHHEMAQAINRLCWNEADGFYYDLGYGRQIPRRHIGMYWTLLADVVPPQRRKRFLVHLTDPRQFWRKIAVASYPADQQGYDPKGGYWLGGVWAPTTYMVIRGLAHCGEHALAARLARDYYRGVAAVFRQTGTFWENYAPDAYHQGEPARPDFCGWSAIAPITLYREYDV